MSQQCVLVTKKAKGIPPGIPQEEHCQQVEAGDPASLLSSREAHLECCVQFWASQDKRDMEILEQLMCHSLGLRHGDGEAIFSILGKTEAPSLITFDRLQESGGLVHLEEQEKSLDTKHIHMKYDLDVSPKQKVRIKDIKASARKWQKQE
ncbi:hypothetical protein DUI87_05954 [Hirundo rustica rustica]|uniref:Uncharacterized protein n=1 Tax=Hirundo rustica rustica TaxID=333673 RepID=A0A3M0KW33_HIRRU|nr:hypothetical protein DUI87_05954 [Hirundo rustica rustica]